MKALSTLLFTILFLSSLYPQKFLNLKTYNVDSLLLTLPDQVGEERVKSLNNLAISLHFIDDEASTKYAEEALNLAMALDYQEDIAVTYRVFMRIYFYQGEFPKALENGFKALSIFESLDDKHMVANIYFEIAWVHWIASNYEKSIEHLYIAFDYYNKRTNNESRVGTVKDFVNVYGTFAEVYYRLRMPEKSLEYYLKELDLMKRNKYKNIEKMLVTWLIGRGYRDVGEPDSAKVYLNKALAYPDEDQSMKALKFNVIRSMGLSFYFEGAVDSAIYYTDSAYSFYKRNGFLLWEMITSNTLGSIYKKINQLDSAEKYYLHAERIFLESTEKQSWHRYDSLKYIPTYGFELYFPVPPVRQQEMIWDNSRYMYFGLYHINAVQNRINEALNYYIAYSDAKDTLNKLQRNRETIELQTRYESERKDQQIETLSLENELKETRLDQNRYLLFGSLVLLIVILMFGYILFRQNKLKTEQQMMGLKQRLFRSQMNPHFIFNSLASIQNFVVRQDSKKASIYLSRFSELVRSILDSSAEEYIPFEKEKRTIENYLELQKIRFPDKFDYTIDVDEKIDAENMLVPPMLAQPFIENSIEHGFKHSKTRGNLKIRFSIDHNMIVIEIEDDGIGREKAKEIGYKFHKDHRSMATDITRERLAVLNKKLKQKILLVITDLKNEKGKPVGTKVILDIPVKYV